MLAEELYAMFQADGLVVDGPLTINNSTTDPAITVTLQNPDASPDIEVEPYPNPEEEEEAQEIGRAEPMAALIISGSDTAYRILPYPDGPLQEPSGVVEATAILNSNSASQVEPGTWVLAVRVHQRQEGVVVTPGSYYFIAPAGGGGGGIPAKITAGGPGVTYTAELYEDGPSEAATASVTVTALQLDAAETVPANTWVIALQIGASYFFQPPVWL